jgi:8-oxo-dGTP diphosphatase
VGKRRIAGVTEPAVGVTFFCHDGLGNVALQLRGLECRDEQGRWDIGAGQLEWGQTPEEAVRAEVAEEYRAEILQLDFLGYRSVVREEPQLKQARLGTHWVMLDFKVLVRPETVRNGEPHKFDRVGWFPVTSIPTPIHSQVPFFLDKYRLGYLAAGTRIRFRETLDAPASGDHPPLLYANAGEEGEIVGHGTLEGYWVKADGWPEKFGASVKEFIVL